MGIVDDIGEIPLKMAEGFYKKGYFLYIILGILAIVIWILSK